LNYNNNNNHKQGDWEYDSSKYRDPDLVSFLRRRLLIMRLKERVMILLIAACCVLCVLFVIQSRISDDVIWEYPKKYK
jgi:phage gp36-like protein